MGIIEYPNIGPGVTPLFLGSNVSVRRADFRHLVVNHPGFASIILKTVSKWLRRPLDQVAVTS
jgi:hypothetical protein